MALDLRYGKDDSHRNLRTTFDSDTANYDAMRPRYCPALFDSVISRTSLTARSHALEIGPGTGQATERFLDIGCPITAVELGEKMAAYLTQKYADFPQLSVWQGDFLAFPEENRFDLIYSATAFHWIPREEGLAKVKRLLRSGGTLALFWNHPMIDPMQNETLQEVYERFDHGRNSTNPFDGSTCPAYARALEEAGFSDVKWELFRSQRVLTGKEYVQLMRTYSDHAALPEAKREALEKAMEETILALGDRLVIRDVMDLYLATL